MGQRELPPLVIEVDDGGGGQEGSAGGATPRGGGRRPMLFVGLAILLALVAFGAFSLVRAMGDGGSGSSPLATDGVLTSVGVRPMDRPVAQDHEERWDMRLPDSGSLSDAAASADLVYLLLDSWDPARLELLAVDRSTGNEIWDVDITRAMRIDDWNHSRVVLHGDVVLVGVSAYGADEQVLALDASAGEELWEQRGGGGIVPQAGRQVWLSDWERREGVMVDTRTGERQARVRGEQFAILGDMIIVADEDEVRVVQASDGSVVWEERLRRDIRSVVGAPGRVIVRSEDLLVVLDARTGEELWDERLHNNWGAVYGFDDVIVVSDDGDLLAFDLDGNEIWSVRDLYPAVPIVSQGRQLILATIEDSVVLIDASSGDELGDIRTVRPDHEAQLLGQGDGASLVLLEEAGVRAVSTQNLEERWSSRVGRNSGVRFVDRGLIEVDWERGFFAFHE